MADTPEQPEEGKKKTEPINIKSGEKKSDTTRIDLASAKPPPSIVDKDKLPHDAEDYFKRSTMRIETPGSAGGKDETTKLDPASAKDETAKIDANKAKTSKIDMSEAAKSEDDVFKSKTIPVGIPTPPPQEAKPARPKTIQFKRPAAPKAAPGESIIVSPENTADAAEQARKSETARIDLADEANRPTTRPKTIRIKRPDGTSGKKALAITRPQEGESAAPKPAPQVESESTETEGADTIAAVVAIAALVVVGVVLYVLLAQTYAPDLPFPGRI